MNVVGSADGLNPAFAGGLACERRLAWRRAVISPHHHHARGWRIDRAVIVCMLPCGFTVLNGLCGAMCGPSKKITSDSGELPTKPVPLGTANSVDVTGKWLGRNSTVWSRTGSIAMYVTLVWMRDFQ
ncbi:hypothetical protein AB0H34_00790 [Saccharopolyspora shandongensis]|uniref:hypothetical protein n=1 Tax=Saccharopolyspora shandongensis TaxID=418495 RepID=UPI0033F2CE0B